MAAGELRLGGRSGRASAAVVASTILDMCVQSAKWMREDGPFAPVQVGVGVGVGVGVEVCIVVRSLRIAEAAA